jgi:hypothetical protein
MVDRLNGGRSEGGVRVATRELGIDYLRPDRPDHGPEEEQTERLGELSSQEVEHRRRE